MTDEEILAALRAPLRPMGDIGRQDRYGPIAPDPVDVLGRAALARDAGVGNLGGGRYRPPARYYGPEGLELGAAPQRYIPGTDAKTFEGIAGMATHPERFNSAFGGYMRRPASPNIIDRRNDPPLNDRGGYRPLSDLLAGEG